jgi:YebC/PmpR family DNA-binding regulatory protein
MRCESDEGGSFRKRGVCGRITGCEVTKAAVVSYSPWGTLQMSGHSKWHSIKHKKGAIDAKRGKAFSKLIKELTVAARVGGGDAGGNPRLRKAMDDAKAVNMPKDTMMNAIKRGTGEIAGAAIEDISYEGYGPGGVAVFIEAQTDNRTRTVAEIRHLFSKNGGNLGEAGSVAWMFQKRGMIIIEKTSADEEKIMELALEAGAEDVGDDGESWDVVTSPEDFNTVLDAIKSASIDYISAEIVMRPTNSVQVSGATAQQVLRLMEALEDHDDVARVSANFDIPAEELEAAG